MDAELFFIIWIVVGIVIAITASIIAERKGRSGGVATKAFHTELKEERLRYSQRPARAHMLLGRNLRRADGILAKLQSDGFRHSWER
jgi:hypothetical protein